MRGFWSLPVLLRLALASKHGFSVQDDVLAFPQYEIVYTNKHVSELEAQSRVIRNEGLDVDFGTDSSDFSEVVALHRTQPGGDDREVPRRHEKEQFEYDILKLNGQRYLCQIPQVEVAVDQDTNDTLSKADEEKELARANDRGWTLLKGLQGNCIYFWSGWWSYRYCYGEGVKQFHQLPPAAGSPLYPPIEDPGVTPFVLGKWEDSKEQKTDETGLQRSSDTEPTGEVSAMNAPGYLESRGDTRYLVQRLSGGTTCDLTGKPRRVEVQFHCNPATSDRISLIKEVATCAYLMVIQTPRLCNDVAFLPPRKDSPNAISCSPIIPKNQAADAVAEQAASAAAEIASRFPNPFAKAPANDEAPSIGGIVLGAHKWIPADQELQKSAAVGGNKETYVETIADSLGKMLTAEQLKKMGLGDVKNVERLKKELEKMAGDKGWKLEVFDTPTGKEYRGVIGDPEEGEEGDHKGGKERVSDRDGTPEDAGTEHDDQQGSEEEYYVKEEL